LRLEAERFGEIPPRRALVARAGVVECTKRLSVFEGEPDIFSFPVEADP
jgi:hypothetical protein